MTGGDLNDFSLADVLVSFSAATDPYIRVPDSKKVDAATALTDRVVALYFGCAPSADGSAAPANGMEIPDYVPLIKTVYEEVKAKRSGSGGGGDAKAADSKTADVKSAAIPPFEVLTVSCDDSKSEWQKTFKSMPHGTIALPYKV